MDITEIKKLSRGEIYKEINKNQIDLLKKKVTLRLQVTQKSSSEGINVSEIRKIKRYIARLKTVLREKEYLENNK
jgi:ribosomal protein L29